MILVTSAAGNMGRAMVKKLVDSGLDVLATDLNPNVTELPGIKEAMVGDLTDLSFIDGLMKKVDKVVYIPPLFSSEEALIGQRMVDKAIEYNIQHFVFNSVIHPILNGLLQHIAKRDVEEYLIYKGMETQICYTILQPMHYMYNFNPQMVTETGEYRIFYDLDRKIGYVDAEDVAEVAVTVLKDPVKHNKATYELVGTEAYSPKDLVTIFNQVTGKNAVASYVDVEDFLDEIHANDLYFREAFKHLAHAYSTSGLDGNTNVLEWLLGRKPTSFEEYVKEKLND